MRRTFVAATSLALLALGGAAAVARNPQPAADKLRERPEAFQALLACRAISDEKARLQCYDGAAATMEQAADRHDLVIVDRKQVRETKRTLFGIDLPRLNLFGGGDNDADEVKEVEGVVSAAYQDGNGRWVVKLEDGATWAQIDNNVISLRPKPGQKVKIHRGAIGSYIMNVNGQAGVKARRQI